MTKRKAKGLSTAAVFSLAEKREQEAVEEARAKAAKFDADKQIIEELHTRRKIKSLESDQFGRFTRITVVAPERVEYDEAGLWSDLKPRQRRMAYNEFVNLNALPEDARLRVLAVLSGDERKAVTTHSLSTDRLAVAVADGKIDPKVISKHAAIKQNAPHIRISHGTGE